MIVVIGNILCFQFLLKERRCMPNKRNDFFSINLSRFSPCSNNLLATGVFYLKIGNWEMCQTLQLKILPICREPLVFRNCVSTLDTPVECNEVIFLSE
ncbi:hypothetical protein SPOG_05568 [Schizosaccharomyces cryophilus OY26]|uniref:Uncharacterized protein n=1 Tax=Schizosaccharomyces cryophilus (strain OY26 / ATCC MYA-4695 / CBS 11777 / NBRC 106824 / NRRL Y48691) TaxID=653667 RepID=S9XAU3_SCHCR|nr:uncharacterized protein SPOG_05568 [Schizosaccharomyces cryophilus OY26]EPY54272.1 hypothetical protein SPOG_05568 [Schizosaccharomyces cryophilus OY26]